MTDAFLCLRRDNGTCIHNSGTTLKLMMTFLAVMALQQQKSLYYKLTKEWRPTGFGVVLMDRYTSGNDSRSSRSQPVLVSLKAGQWKMMIFGRIRKGSVMAFLNYDYILPWRLKQQLPSGHKQQYTLIYDVTSQRTSWPQVLRRRNYVRQKRIQRVWCQHVSGHCMYTVNK
jgi:hypothetical protein